VAEINLDMIARNPRDTVGFVGKDYTSLGALVDRLLAEHSELGLVSAEHEGRYGASDHYPFAERGVPALFFFSGEHADLHTAADNPDHADVEQAARIVRLAFLAGLEVANAAERPTWKEEPRGRIVRVP
jgi:Zn-dependent M28 family amino/carboxypeptidase